MSNWTPPPDRPMGIAGALAAHGRTDRRTADLAAWAEQLDARVSAADAVLLRVIGSALASASGPTPPGGKTPADAPAGNRNASPSGAKPAG